MFFGVKELELRKIRFAAAFPPGQIEFSEPGLTQRTPLEVEGTAELLGAVREIRVRGRLRGEMECACDRCLESVAVPMDGDFDLSYRPDECDWEVPESGLSDAESRMGFYEGGGLALAEVVREQVLLWLPMQRICRPECKGICPMCGQNRNAGECGCRVEQIDERWQALREL
jgi:uncharacterized protein